jgi:3-methyladenine DNA glycosylase AlkC
MTNSPIENYFNQIKTYIKKKRDVYSFEELAKNVDTSIERVKPENYKNYFDYAYGTNKKTEYTRKLSTRKHKLKLYKDI